MRDMNFDACILACMALKWVCYIIHSMPACQEKLSKCPYKLRVKAKLLLALMEVILFFFFMEAHMSRSMLLVMYRNDRNNSGFYSNADTILIASDIWKGRCVCHLSNI